MRLFRKPVRVRSSTDEITMTQHLGELRFRIIRSLLAVVIGALVILSFYDPVLRFLTEPYRDLCTSRPDFNCDGTLYGLGPLDGISARMRIASYGGLVVALPVILWQISRKTLCNWFHHFQREPLRAWRLHRLLDPRQSS